jgi:hypothetical protein
MIHAFLRTYSPQQPSRAAAMLACPLSPSLTISLSLTNCPAHSHPSSQICIGQGRAVLIEQAWPTDMCRLSQCSACGRRDSDSSGAAGLAVGEIVRQPKTKKPRSSRLARTPAPYAALSAAAHGDRRDSDSSGLASEPPGRPATGEGIHPQRSRADCDCHDSDLFSFHLDALWGWNRY